MSRAVVTAALALGLALAAAPWAAWIRLLAECALLLPIIVALPRARSDRLGRDPATMRFVVNLVHELRTPIALVDGPLQQLGRNGNFDDEARALIAVARQNCLRLVNVAEDLLELAHADAGVPAIRSVPAALELDPWLRELAGAVARHPALGRRLVTEELDAAGVYVAADARTLERIYLNLVSNAIKFGAGGRGITIGSLATPTAAGFFVADDGIGIDPAHHAAIFERFHQLDPSATRRFAGVGIGLALVRELVTRLHGRVDVESRAGAGARFTIWLPRCAPPATARLLPAARRTGGSAGSDDAFEWMLRQPLATLLPGEAPPARADRHRLLIVEDEPEMRWLLAAALAASFDVVAAPDGEAGFEAALRERPDVVLTDWMMPTLDGLTLAQRLRALDAPPPVVLITARMDEQQRTAALQNGIHDFVAKPFSLAELGARLTNLAQRAAAERALRTAHDRLAAVNQELTSTRAALVQDEKLKSIGMLSAGLIHEINNPVNFMRTATELLRRAVTPLVESEAAELVDAIDHGLQRVAAIIADLRVFAYRDDDPARRRQRFAIGHAIGAALRLCRPRLNAIRIDLQDGAFDVVGAEGQIVQVLVNLLVNAAAALNENTFVARPAPAIQIRTEFVSRTSRVQIAVRDNGPGITAATRERLFEPFFTTREPGKGLGLGLAVSEAIVRAHGGELRVSSVPSAGAEFTFDLELAA